MSVSARDKLGRAGRLLREPLLQFLVIGAMIFLADRLVGTGAGEANRDRIVVTAGRVQELAERWRRTRQRPPTPRELQGLIEEHVRDEVFAREAMALGMHRDDMIIRRRLRQKMEFVAEGFVGGAEPAPDELTAYFDRNSERYAIPAILSFAHVYLNPDAREGQARADAKQLLAELHASTARSVDPSSFGDPFLLPHRFEKTPLDEVAIRFGSAFAKRLGEIEPKRWTGPIESGFGLHLVIVHERVPGRIPVLDEVRDAIVRDLDLQRRKDAVELLYGRLRERYEIVIEQPQKPVTLASGGGP